MEAKEREFIARVREDLEKSSVFERAGFDAGYRPTDKEIREVAEATIAELRNAQPLKQEREALLMKVAQTSQDALLELEASAQATSSSKATLLNTAQIPDNRRSTDEPPLKAGNFKSPTPLQRPAPFGSEAMIRTLTWSMGSLAALMLFNMCVGILTHGQVRLSLIGILNICVSITLIVWAAFVLRPYKRPERGMFASSQAPVALWAGFFAIILVFLFASCK